MRPCGGFEAVSQCGRKRVEQQCTETAITTSAFNMPGTALHPFDSLNPRQETLNGALIDERLREAWSPGQEEVYVGQGVSLAPLSRFK